MEVKIIFNSELYLTGENLEEIREKFESMELYAAEACRNDIAYGELEYVERTDDGSCKDLIYVFGNGDSLTLSQIK